MRGFDEAWLPRIVAEGLANLPHARLQRRVADEHVRPQRVQEILFRDEMARRRDEVGQHGERLWSQPNGLPVARQCFVVRVEGESAKCDRMYGDLSNGAGKVSREAHLTLHFLKPASLLGAVGLDAVLDEAKELVQRFELRDRPSPYMLCAA